MPENDSRPSLPNRYKERKPKDPIIAEKFNTYRFRNYRGCGGVGGEGNGR